MGELESYYPSPEWGDYPGMKLESPEHKAQLAAQLAEFGLTYDQRLSPEENQLRAKLFQHFREAGVAQTRNRQLVIDDEKLQAWLYPVDKGSPRVGRQDFNKDQLFTVLGGVEAYSKTDVSNDDRGNQEAPRTRPILALPKTLDALYSGDYAAENQRAIIKIWNVMPKSYPENRPPVKIDDGNKVSLKDLRMVADLDRLGVGYDKNLSRGENRNRHEALRYFFDKNWMSLQNDSLVVDDDAIRRNFQKENNFYNKSAVRHNILSTFRGLKGYTKTDLARQADGHDAIPPRDLMSLPDSVGELATTYPQTVQRSIFKPWEFAIAEDWVKDIILKSGEKTNCSELAIASILQNSLKAQRHDGILEITNPRTEKRERVAFSRFDELAEVSPIYKQFSLESYPREFAQRYLSNLMELGVLEDQDFRRFGGGRTAEIFNVHEKKLNPKNPYVMFSTEGGSARYYVGREKLVGSHGKEIDHKSMRVRQLDPTTAGITDDINRKKTLLYTFSLLNKEELAVRQEEVRGKFIKKEGREPTLSELSANVFVNAAAMRQQMREYDITDYLPPRANEEPKDYARRLIQLGDVEFVSKTTQQFFAEAGIGTHNLPWAEQLSLSRILLEEKNKDRLLNFARNFNLTGLRAFLSMDFDRQMGEAVLTLGEKLKHVDAAAIFVKYSKIADAANQVEDYLREHFPEKYRQDKDAVNQIHYNLLEKGKTLLGDFAAALQRGEKVDSWSVVSKLIPLHEEILMFGSTFKELAREGKKVDFAEIAKTNLEVVDSGSLTEAQKDEMKSIFLRNRQTYKPELLKETSEEFEHALETPGKEFHILTHGQDVISFIRFDHLPNGNLYTGSLNVVPEARGSAIGHAMLRATLDKKAEENTVEAVVYAKNPMLKHYVNDFGFQIVGDIPDYKGTGELFYKLERPQIMVEAEERKAA